MLYSPRVRHYRQAPHGRLQLMPDLARAADKDGTPVYVTDMVSVDAAARQIEAAFGGPWLLHSWPDGFLQRCRRPDVPTPAMASAEPHVFDPAPAPTGSPNLVLCQPATAQPRHCG